MNKQSSGPIADEAEIALTEARLAKFDRDGMGHDLQVVKEWSAARLKDPSAPCPQPTKLR